MLLTFLFQLNAGAEDKKLFHQMTAADGLYDNSVQAIKCTYSGRITILTLGNVNFYDGAGFSQIRGAQETKYYLKDYHGKDRLFYDNNHHLWLKDSTGVACVNLTTEKFFTNVDSILATYGANRQVDNLFVDTNGDIWLHMSNYIYNHKYGHKFAVRKNANLEDIEVYGQKQLLMFYNDGVMVCYDAKSGRQLYQTMPYGADDAKIYTRGCVRELHGDTLFLIRDGRNGSVLSSYNLKTKKWTEIVRQEYHLNNLVIHAGSLYISSDKGYFTYDLGSGELTHYEGLRMNNGRRLETDINVIDFDLQGGMWIGTDTRGLLYSSPLNVSVHQIASDSPEAAELIELMRPLKGISEFKGKKVNMVFFDSRRWTWVATPHGLHLYKTPHDEPVVYSLTNGLFNDVVHAIVEDDYHDIWISTSNGIVCLHIVGNKVKQTYYFGASDNVPNETFLNAKGMKLPNGQIIMQSLDHVVMFDPVNFQHFFNMDAYVMYPKLSKLLVNGINVEAGDEVAGSVVLEKAITRTKVINLTYEQNTISMTFSAQNYARPLKTFYRVRVVELDKEWKDYSYYTSNGLVDRKGQLHLPLTNLEPGTYHVQLLSSMIEGEYVGEVYEWIINVHQPWWRTTGLISLFGLILFALLVTNMLIYNRNTRLKMQRNSEENDVISRIKSFVDRCDTYNNEKIAPTQEEIYGTDSETRINLSDDFVDVMLRIIPYVHERKGRSFSMHMLANAIDMDVIELYGMISENIHKSPRVLIRSMRIDQVAEQLRTTDKTVEDIANDCGFVSPNYMIAKFYHRFKMTPREYREELAQ